MKSSGFTFVEVLVVSIFVAILAAVAIPMYTGYIEKQRKSVVKNLATTGAVTGNVYYRRHNADPTWSDLNLYLTDSARYRGEVSGNRVIVHDDLGGGDVISDTAEFR